MAITTRRRSSDRCGAKLRAEAAPAGNRERGGEPHANCSYRVDGTGVEIGLLDDAGPEDDGAQTDREQPNDGSQSPAEPGRDDRGDG